MNSYAGRTRPVPGFVDIGFALRGYRMLNDCPLNPGNSTEGSGTGLPVTVDISRSVKR
jgi:hypothetical protein